VKLLVPVKQVPDPNAIRFDASGSFAASTPRVVNEYDQYALEEAIALLEAGKAEEVVVLSIGPATARDAITRGLAMGADRGVLVLASDSDLTSLQVAAIIAAEAQAGSFDLIFVGQETSDGGSGNVGPQLAALLDYPLISNVVELELGDGTITMQREVEDGRHVVEVQPPAVICTLIGLNEPRSPTLKGIMAARRKVIEEKSIGDYETPDAQTEWGRVYAEQRVMQGTIIETDPESAAKQVVELLRERKLI
jgi:electron transfer flavoprotein beta subunit